MHTAVPTPSAATAQYAVPKRFGMAGILAITTLMAVLFGLLRSCGAHPVVYVFVGLLALATCLVQMWYGDVPRIASIAAGALFMPLCVIGFAVFALAVDDRVSIDEVGLVICTLPLLVVAGAVCGYLSGACTAGLFLLMDLAEPYLPGGGGDGHLKYARPVPPRVEPPPPAYLTASVVDHDPREAEIITAMLAADNPYVPTRGVSSPETFDAATEPTDRPPD